MFVVSDEDDVDGMQDAGVALIRAYNYIKDEVDSQSAFDAVVSVSGANAHNANKNTRSGSEFKISKKCLNFG